MKLNRIMIVSLLLLAILAIGAVSASQDVDTLDVEEVDDLSIDESSDIVTANESSETLEDVGIYINSGEYSTTEPDEDNSVVNFEMPIDSDGAIVVSSGDKELYNKECNDIEHKWGWDNPSGRKGLWINNYELNLTGISNGDIVTFSFISDASQTYSKHGKIHIDGDMFSFKELYYTDYLEDPIYLDTPDGVVNIPALDSETEGAFYVAVNGREYKYLPYFNEWGDAWHSWKLSSFDITATGQYPVTIRYAIDGSYPGDIVRYGVLNVIEFANDTFRANLDTHNNINLFCPDNIEGNVSIFMKNNWDDEYPAEAALTYEINSPDFNTWKTWNFADLGCEKWNEYIFRIVVSGDGFDDIVVMNDQNRWYNDPYDVYITPKIEVEAYDDHYDNGRDDDCILCILIPEKENVYEGTLEIRNGETVIYTKDLTTAEMDFNDEWRDYRYELKYRDVKSILVDLDNAVLTFSFNYNTNQVIQPLVMVKVINKQNYEIELERAFGADIYNEVWRGIPLYLDYNGDIVNIDVRNPAADGIFYISANGKEYQYQANFDEEGRAWHNWVLSSFDITEADTYHVTIEYANDADSPRITVMEGDLNVIEFANDTFRATVDTHNNINLFCPDNSEGNVSIFMKNNWEDEYPAQAALTYEITSDDFNTWKTWNFAELECEKENEYIFRIVVSRDGFDDIVVMNDKNQWYNDPWDIHITPQITLEAYEGYFDNERDDDGILGIFIPEKDNVYQGTLEITNGETVIYSKELTTADMDFDDNSRDYRYWLKYKDVKNILVNYDNAALTFSFNYNTNQTTQPLVIVKVNNKQNYEIELERAFGADIYNEEWRDPLYLDYNRDIVNIDVRNPAANGIFYINANGKEYQYQANFDEEGRAWHNWVLSSFDITEADTYHVTIEYANDADSPRITVMEGDLNVIEFANDTFRITENRPAQLFSVFCPEGSEGSVISIFMKDDWDDENPTKIKDIIITPDNCGDWLDLSFADIGMKRDDENIIVIKILDGDNELLNPYETGIWYDNEPYEPFIPTELIVNINGDDFRSEDEEHTVIDMYIPEKLMIYNGTVSITSKGRTIYSKEISLRDMEFDENGRYYQFRIEFEDLSLDGLNSGDIVKFAFTNDVKTIEKSVFYVVNNDEDDEWVNFKLINFKDGNFLDDEVLIEVADFPDGVDDEFKIIVDKWGDEKELTFKISELERNEDGLYVWNCSQLEIDDFMEDMTDADIRFVFRFSNGEEIEGECWVYKDPCISWGEFANTNEDGPVIEFMHLPDELEGSIIIRITGNSNITLQFDTRADIDQYYVEPEDEEDDEAPHGWIFRLEDLGHLRQYGTYDISVEMTKNGKQVYYNSTIELVDYEIETRTNLDQITSAVFRILLDEDASGNVTIYVNDMKVFENTLEWIGYSFWNRMGGFNIPLNYLQITESGSYDVRLEVKATDDREEVMTRIINHHIDVEVEDNNIAFGDIIYQYHDNFLYPTSLKTPIPLDAEFILYLNGVEAGRTRIDCNDFMFYDLDLDESLLDGYGSLKPGTYNAEIRQVSEQGNVTYTGSFEVRTTSGDVEVIVPATVTTIDDVKVAISAPRPDEYDIDNTGLIIFIDPFLNEEGEFECDNIMEMWGWELVEYLENNQYIVLDSLSAGTHKILVQYLNEGDDGQKALEYPFFKNFFTVNVKKAATQITASAVTATYKATKKLVVTLKDAKGRILAGKRVTVKVGTITKTLTTNSKGQISVDVSSLVPKSYTATITFAGDGTYLASTKTVKVVVNKAKTKLTAKKVKVKVSVKAKKVTAVLKFNTNKVLKSKYVTLKINKKTYKVKTNKKGQAIFKVKNLKRKGTFTGVLKFKGDKYYKASTYKVKVVVK